MPSALGHAAAALALGTACRPTGAPARFWVLGATCAMLPDLDVVGFRLGIPYGHVLGHRGLSHSLLFAAVVATLGTWALVHAPRWKGMRGALWAYVFLATASHGLLDAMTDGGLGVAFFAPMENTRYFLPWRPIEVSPIGLRRFVEGRGLAVLASEARWVLLPSAAFAVGSLVWRRVRQRLRAQAA